MDFVSLDFETATESRCSICQIGITIVKNSGIIENKAWLVKPEGNRYSLFNTMIHGITPKDTENSPSFPEIWPEISSYLNGNIVVAHNASFDMYVLKESLEHYSLPWPNFQYYCSCRLARCINPDLGCYTLRNVCAFYKIPLLKHHSADCDSEACARIFLKEIEDAAISDISELATKYKYECGSFSSSGFIAHRIKRDYSFHKKVDAEEIISSTEVEEINPNIAGLNICLTGTLCNRREDILRLIARYGGIPANSVTKNTDILVVGVQDNRIVGDSGMSSKQKKAIELQNKGAHIRILSEIDFFDLLNS